MAGTRSMGPAWTAALLGAAVLLGGCTGGEDAASEAAAPAPADTAAISDAVGQKAAGQDAVPDAGAAEASSAAAGGTAGGTAGDAAALPGAGGTALDAVALAGREVVFTADLSVEVQDVAAAAARAEDLVVAAAGLVEGEDRSRDPGSPGTATTRLTLRVPPEAFRPTLASLAALGSPTAQTQSAQDVSGEVADLDSRLSTQRASIERVRALLARAGDIEDVVRIEGELARREAELESLAARRARLGGLTALSTITVTLLGPGADVVAAAAEEQGFLAGFTGGWAAFRAVVVVMLTVLGAALPFVLVGAVLAAALLAVRRRRRAVAPRPS